MVNLTRDEDGKTRATLLDLIRGWSGGVRHWLQERGEAFRAAVKIATLTSHLRSQEPLNHLYLN